MPGLGDPVPLGSGAVPEPEGIGTTVGAAMDERAIDVTVVAKVVGKEAVVETDTIVLD